LIGDRNHFWVKKENFLWRDFRHVKCRLFVFSASIKSLASQILVSVVNPMSTPISNDKLTIDILQLLYNRVSDNPEGSGVDRAIIQATVNVSEKQMDDSIAYLETNGLVSVSRAGGSKWTFAKITGDGIDVVENKERYAEKFTFTQTASSQAPADGGQPRFSQKMQPQLSFPEQLTEAFRQASDQVLSAKISTSDKGKIEKQLKSLQKELLKGAKADLGSIQKDWEWLNKNANWLHAAVGPMVLEALKIRLDLP
jgi:hypothetical protein